MSNEHAGAEDRATQRVGWWVAGNYGDGEATCRQWEAMTAKAFEAMQEAIAEGATSDEAKDHAVYELADELKDWFDAESPEVQSVWGDLVGYMEACVDWRQLATDAIEQREIEAR